MSGRRLLRDAFTAELPELLPAGTEVLAGEPRASERSLGQVGDAFVGVWELTQGVVRDVEVDEVFVVLSGRGSVRFERGETIDLVPGTVVRLTAGERTEWTVTATLRKVYVAR